jgi:hypothetical protein
MSKKRNARESFLPRVNWGNWLAVAQFQFQGKTKGNNKIKGDSVIYARAGHRAFQAVTPLACSPW